MTVQHTNYWYNEQLDYKQSTCNTAFVLFSTQVTVTRGNMERVLYVNYVRMAHIMTKLDRWVHRPVKSAHALM